MTDINALSAAKQQLRAKLRFRRKHFAANLDGMAALAAFRAAPAPLEDLLKAHTDFSAYVPVGDEVDIIPLLSAFAQDGIALPFHAKRDEHMEFRLWPIGAALEAGPWRTPQPSEECAQAAPSLIFCPLVGFDRSGGRLGQGGGHYDRYFARHPQARRVGVAWSIQEVDFIPSEPTDMRLDAILTEQEYILCGDRII